MTTTLTRLRGILARLRGRHTDGTPHEWARVVGWTHYCDPMSYCHHYTLKCTSCGDVRIEGDSILEVR